MYSLNEWENFVINLTKKFLLPKMTICQVNIMSPEEVTFNCIKLNVSKAKELILLIYLILFYFFDIYFTECTENNQSKLSTKMFFFSTFFSFLIWRNKMKTRNRICYFNVWKFSCNFITILETYLNLFQEF